MDGLVQGRFLSPEDVETARGLLDQHQPTARGGVCASATHLIDAPAWPCAQHRWAKQVLAAEERGEVEDTPANVKRTPE